MNFSKNLFASLLCFSLLMSYQPVRGETESAPFWGPFFSGAFHILGLGFDACGVSHWLRFIKFCATTNEACKQVIHNEGLVRKDADDVMWGVQEKLGAKALYVTSLGIGFHALGVWMARTKKKRSVDDEEHRNAGLKDELKNNYKKPMPS